MSLPSPSPQNKEKGREEYGRKNRISIFLLHSFKIYTCTWRWKIGMLETHVSFDHPIHANEYIKNIFIASDLNHDSYLDLWFSYCSSHVCYYVCIYVHVCICVYWYVCVSLYSLCVPLWLRQSSFFFLFQTCKNGHYSWALQLLFTLLLCSIFNGQSQEELMFFF